jgi:hypothetical protein
LTYQRLPEIGTGIFKFYNNKTGKFLNQNWEILNKNWEIFKVLKINHFSFFLGLLFDDL